MARTLRNSLATAILVAGIVYSLPIQPGHTGSEPAPISAPMLAAFEITERRRTVTLSGHTVSARHEARLKQAAITSFGEHEFHFEFRPLGIVPDWWETATTELLGALADTHSLSAQLKQDALHISAITSDQAKTEERILALRRVLPDSLETGLQLLATGPRKNVRELCEQQYAGFSAGPVNFEESGTLMRPSAHAELDRVVALADACRDARVVITGHTDSSGSETWNRQLSLARASAVADYLADRGISAERLIVEGAGSAFPVADNATRFGRGLNRRIEIDFTPDS